MFHVPHLGRLRSHPFLRSSDEDGNNGAFMLPSPEPAWTLFALASDGLGWEHVSVHAARERGRTIQTRTPSWHEMVYVKDIFWDDDDVVMQLHPCKREYVNLHPHTLHLWRPTGATTPIPTPPMELVGPQRGWTGS